MRTRETERPPSQNHVLHFHVPRLVALRGGDRNEETPKTENRRGMLMRRACARTLSTQPAQLFAAGAKLAAHTQPALRTGLMAPAWRLLRAYLGEQFLTSHGLFRLSVFMHLCNSDHRQDRGIPN